MTWLKDLWTSAYNLSPERRKLTVRIVTAIAIVMGLLTILLACKAAATSTHAESPIWEMVILARLVLAKSVAACGLWVLALSAGLISFQALDNSALGMRLWVWSEADTEAIKAEKKRNAGSTLAVLILSAAILFSAVLR